jgi:Zn-dependent protease with chaperone function
MTTLRAALALALLAGFYVLAFAVVAGLGWLAVWAVQNSDGAAAAKLVVVALGAAAGVLLALWRVLRAKPEPPEGVLVTPEQQPLLWQRVRELAGAAGTRVPDDIRLIPEVNAAVTEDTRLLGLRGGPRHLFLGVPLLQALTVSQVTAVLAHELGHYSRSHTRLGAISYRGRMAVVHTIVQVGPRSLAGLIFRGYVWLYFLVESAVSRRQELEADQIAARVAGKASAAGALRELPVADTAWAFYLDRYVSMGWDLGLAPADFFGGFGQLLAARTEELATSRSEALPTRTSRWDSHPSIASRIAAIEALPNDEATTDEATTAADRPASVLIDGFESLAATVAEGAVKFDQRRRLGWAEFTAAAVGMAEQRQADVIFRVAARLVRAPQGTLAHVLRLVEEGRLGDLVNALHPDRTRDAASFAGEMALLLRVAGVRSMVAYWRHSWSGPAELVTPTGEPLELGSIARLACNPSTVESAVGRLSLLGIGVEYARQVEATASAAGSELLGAMANLKVNEKSYDVFILDRGLVLVPGPKSTDGGQTRLLELVTRSSPADLARQHRFVAFEDIATATVVKRVPLRAELVLHSGERLSVQEPWSGEQIDKTSRDELLERLQAYAPA